MTTVKRAKTADTEIISADIAILGSGLTAQIMGHSLAGCGYQIVWLNGAPASTSRADNRTTTIHAGGQRMLHALGIWQRISPPPTPIHHIKVGAEIAMDVSANATDWPLCFDGAASTASMGPAPMAFTVYNHALIAGVQAHAPAAPIKQLTGAIKSLDFTNHRPRWQFEDGRIAEADLIIGCDGTDSFARQQAGLKSWARPTHQKAIIARLDAEKPHHQTAFQRFLPDGPLALMPLGDNKLALVWSLTEAKAEAFLQADPADFEAALNGAFGPDLGKLRLCAQDGSQRQIWPLRPTIIPRLTAPGLILAGDAAHALHPLAGMGFNLALADMAVLADVLVGARRCGLSPAHISVLEEYRRRRRTEILGLSAATEGLNRLFSHNAMTTEPFSSPKLARLATWGMGLFGRTSLTAQINHLAMGGVLAPANLLEGKLPQNQK